jgi:hypothetical protein
MGALQVFSPVKLFIGVLVSHARDLDEIERRLTSRYGSIDHRSGIIPFDFTDYYNREMGEAIDRIFFSFEQLIDAAELADIKVWTNHLENEIAAAATNVKRPANLDPGYLENAKVILASTKNFYHRIYLGNRIFGEVTMHFRNNTWQFFPWTYPDYQSQDYQEFFFRIRQIYRAQLKARCLIDRRGSSHAE